jgi:hypothetical protein
MFRNGKLRYAGLFLVLSSFLRSHIIILQCRPLQEDKRFNANIIFPYLVGSRIFFTNLLIDNVISDSARLIAVGKLHLSKSIG